MRFPRCLSSIALFISVAALSASSALAQSLSITKKGDTNYWIEASAPAGSPHTLQGSPNLHLWSSIRENVQESFGFELTNAPAAQRYFRLIPAGEAPPPIRVLILGDSVASDCCGWGGGIYRYFNANATVVNYATPWTSTKVFLQSAELDKMLLIKPNYVLIQYGFIDSSPDTDRGTTLEEFAANLRTIVEMVRGFDGVPILITLHAARIWDESGRLLPSWEARNEVTRQMAAELKTPLIDFYKSSFELFSKLGPEGTAFMHWEGGGPGDFIHFSNLGGQYVSRLVVNELPDALGPYLTRIFEPPVVP